MTGQGAISTIDVDAARERLAGVAVRTPVLQSLPLSQATGAAVWLKLENLQVTGSFKVRGAVNKIRSLAAAECERGVVASSSGNHGRAVAHVAQRLGIPATICVPTWVDPVKLAAIRAHGAQAVVYGDSYDEADARSRELEDARGLARVHPFDDPLVMAGQGTISAELLEQVPALDTVVVALSGGGLVAGMALALAQRHANVRVIAASAAHARVMFESLRVGRPIRFPEEPTVASALSGGIGLDNQYTFAAVRDHVQEHVLVEEHEITAAMAFAFHEHRVVVEGGGAAALAAVLAHKVECTGRNLAIVVSGGNADPKVLAHALDAHSL